MIDLHVHSIKSDGTMTPRELVDYGIEKGLSAMALTDHDTVDGIDEALAYAKELEAKGVKVPEIIPGIELSTEFANRDVHILGLYIDYRNAAFCEYLKEFVEARETRNEKMCEMFTKAGMPMDYETLKRESESVVLTRAHFAAYLYEHGYVKSKKEAFERYIGDGKPFHIPREKITPQKGVELIKKAGGIPIFAHPILTKFGKEKLEGLIESLKAEGLMGIEAVYSTYTPSDERYVRELAERYHLLLSGGSDFHGTNKDGIDLAIGTGKLYIDDSILKNIKQSLKKVLFTDLDGTLLLKDSTISREMAGEIKRVTDLGNIVVFASGRPLDSVLEVKNEFLPDVKNMWIIANNGALIYNCDNQKAVYEKKLTSQQVSRIVTLADQKGIHVHSYSEHEIVGYENDEEQKYYRRRIHLPFVEVKNIASYLKDGAYKVQLIDLESREKLENLKVDIMSEMNDEVYCVFSNNKYLEILNKEVNKGRALLYLEDYLHVKHENTYACGDADNDMEMVTAAGVGVAVANATEALKAAADLVTEKSNNENGLLEILKTFN